MATPTLPEQNPRTLLKTLILKKLSKDEEIKSLIEENSDWKDVIYESLELIANYFETDFDPGQNKILPNAQLAFNNTIYLMKSEFMLLQKGVPGFTQTGLIDALRAVSAGDQYLEEMAFMHAISQDLRKGPAPSYSLSFAKLYHDKKQELTHYYSPEMVKNASKNIEQFGHDFHSYLVDHDKIQLANDLGKILYELHPESSNMDSIDMVFEKVAGLARSYIPTEHDFRAKWDEVEGLHKHYLEQKTNHPDLLAVIDGIEDDFSQDMEP